MKTAFPRAGPFRSGWSVLTALVLLSSFLLAAPASAQVGGTAREPFCYTWDFTNSTAQEADDLHVSLRGIRQVTSVYEGSDNVFDAPLPGSHYDAGRDAYHLEYHGGPLPDATTNRIGVCASSAVLRLTDPQQGPAFYWTVGGTSQEPAPVFVGLAWMRLAGNRLRISLYNDQGAALTIWSATLLGSPQPVVLNALGADTLTTLPAVAELAPDVVQLDPGASVSFEGPLLPASVGPDGALLLAVEFSKATDDGDRGRLYAQLLAPQATYLPLILR